MTAVSLEMLQTGFCTLPERVVLPDRGLSRIRLAATVALIRHPRCGFILYDTGYTKRFFEQTRRFPARLYAIATPVTLHPEDTAKAQLLARGIDPAAVGTIILSHFHADHTGGLRDFPEARFIYLQEAFLAVRGLSGLPAILQGVLPGLLPDDFEKRSEPPDRTAMKPLDAEYEPFSEGIDLFGDGSVVGVELPGHACGQLGVFVRTADKTFFLVADACWHRRAFEDLIMPHRITHLLHADMAQYAVTLQKIRYLFLARPDIRIIPCHCVNTLQEERGVSPRAG